MVNPGEWVTDTLWLMTSIALIICVINGIAGLVDRSKRPENQQNLEIAHLRTEITEIKTKLDKFSEYFDNDDKRIRALEEGNRVTMKTLLALSRHSIDGNHTDELQEASKELNQYLIDNK